MIELITKDKMDVDCKKNMVKCPHCQHEHWFVSLVPLACEKCNKAIANALSLQRYDAERKTYHFRGKTLNQSNVVI